MPGRPREAAEELRAVVDAIEARDPDRAAEACVRHIRHAAATATRELGEEPLPR